MTQSHNVISYFKPAPRNVTQFSKNCIFAVMLLPFITVVHLNVILSALVSVKSLARPYSRFITILNHFNEGAWGKYYSTLPKVQDLKRMITASPLYLYSFRLLWRRNDTFLMSLKALHTVRSFRMYVN